MGLLLLHVLSTRIYFPAVGKVKFIFNKNNVDTWLTFLLSLLTTTEYTRCGVFLQKSSEIENYILTDVIINQKVFSLQ